jgi:hypothetical protein
MTRVTSVDSCSLEADNWGKWRSFKTTWKTWTSPPEPPEIQFTEHPLPWPSNPPKKHKDVPVSCKVKRPVNKRKTPYRRKR